MQKFTSDGALLRDLRRPKHFTIDNEFFDDGYGEQVKSAGIAVYAVLCRHANINTSKSFPSIPTISKRTGLSKSQVIRALHILTELHIISYTPQRGRGHSNEYALLDVSEWVKIKGVTQTPFESEDEKTPQRSTKNELKDVTQTPINEIKGVMAEQEKVSHRHPNKQIYNKGGGGGSSLLMAPTDHIDADFQKTSIPDNGNGIAKHDFLPPPPPLKNSLSFQAEEERKNYLHQQARQLLGG